MAARTHRSSKGRAAPGRTRAAVVDRTERGRAVSGRALALGAAVLVVVAMFVPTANAWVSQQQQIRALESKIETDQADVNELEATREKWMDPAFVERQAREKQFYVRPGEKAHIVIDREAEGASGPETVREGEMALPKNDRPWYDEMIDSLRRVGTEPLD